MKQRKQRTATRRTAFDEVSADAFADAFLERVGHLRKQVAEVLANSREDLAFCMVVMVEELQHAFLHATAHCKPDCLCEGCKIARSFKRWTQSSLPTLFDIAARTSAVKFKRNLEEELSKTIQ